MQYIYIYTYILVAKSTMVSEEEAFEFGAEFGNFRGNWGGFGQVWTPQEGKNHQEKMRINQGGVKKAAGDGRCWWVRWLQDGCERSKQYFGMFTASLQGFW